MHGMEVYSGRLGRASVTLPAITDATRFWPAGWRYSKFYAYTIWSFHFDVYLLYNLLEYVSARGYSKFFFSLEAYISMVKVLI